MSSYKVEICGVNTAKLPVLKREEKDALFARIKQGVALPAKLTSGKPPPRLSE